MCSLLVLDKVGESRLNLCLPKDTSSLEGVFLTPMGLLAEVCIRPRGEYFTADELVPFSDTPPLWSQDRGQKITVINKTLEASTKQMILKKNIISSCMYEQQSAILCCHLLAKDSCTKNIERRRKEIRSCASFHYLPTNRLPNDFHPAAELEPTRGGEHKGATLGNKWGNKPSFHSFVAFF